MSPTQQSHKNARAYAEKIRRGMADWINQHPSLRWRRWSMDDITLGNLKKFLGICVNLRKNNIKAYWSRKSHSQYALRPSRVIVDGMECPIKKPKEPVGQQATFSTYKNINICITSMIHMMTSYKALVHLPESQPCNHDSYKVFWWFWIPMRSLMKSDLVAQLKTLGNSCNSSKSNMATPVEGK